MVTRDFQIWYPRIICFISKFAFNSFSTLAPVSGTTEGNHEYEEGETDGQRDDEEYLEDREYPPLLDLRLTTIATEIDVPEPKIISPTMDQSSYCVDDKVWCQFADCSLENVKRNCKKTCNACH